MSHDEAPTRANPPKTLRSQKTKLPPKCLHQAPFLQHEDEALKTPPLDEAPDCRLPTTKLCNLPTVRSPPTTLQNEAEASSKHHLPKTKPPSNTSKRSSTCNAPSPAPNKTSFRTQPQLVALQIKLVLFQASLSLLHRGIQVRFSFSSVSLHRGVVSRLPLKRCFKHSLLED